MDVVTVKITPDELMGSGIKSCRGEYCDAFQEWHDGLWETNAYQSMGESGIENTSHTVADKCAKLGFCVFRLHDDPMSLKWDGLKMIAGEPASNVQLPSSATERSL